MTENKKASFIKGTLILISANLLIKVISAIFRVPLTNLIGDEAMGYYSTAYKYYSILLAISTAGFPVAISKLVSEAKALKRNHEVKRIGSVAFWTAVTLGIGAMLLTFMGSGVLSNLAGIGKAQLSINVLAPTILFMAVAASLRGYFQGHNDMFPTAISQVIENVAKLFVGLFLAYLFIQSDKPIVAAAATAGTTIGAGISAVYLLILYFIRRKKEKTENQSLDIESEKPKVFGRIMHIAIPVTIGALIITITNSIDLLTMANRLKLVGYHDTRLTELFGIFDNYVMTFFNLIPAIMISLNVSITPIISALYAQGEMKSLKSNMTSAIRLMFLLGLPACIAVSTLSKPLLSTFFVNSESVAIAVPALEIMAIASFFLCLSSFTSTSLQALGFARIPVLTMIVGAVVKLACNWYLIPIYQLEGAAIGTIACYFVITLLNFIALKTTINFRPQKLFSFLKIVICSGIMGAFIYFVAPILGLWLTIPPAAIMYLLLIAFSGCLLKEDLLLMPKGEKVYTFLKKYKLAK